MIELALVFIIGFVLGIAVSIICINIYMEWQNKHDKGDTC
jgi:hypothetical protein